MEDGHDHLLEDDHDEPTISSGRTHVHASARHQPSPIDVC